MKRLVFATLLCAIAHSPCGADTDGDGLLDLVDIPGFDPNAEGTVTFYDRDIEDLDGAHLLTSATHLQLNRNQVTSIEQGDFQGLTNLRSLELTDNQITSIEQSDFDGLSELQWLYLGRNQITDIDSRVFAGLAHLQDLFLYENQITSLERGDFDGLDDLQRLYLSGNRISSIEGGDFEGLSNLAWLGLGSNHITSIEKGDFDGLENLGLLSLSGNPLTRIEDGVFRGLNDLHSLHLVSNLAQLNLSGATFDALQPRISTMYGIFGFDVDSGLVKSLKLDRAVLSQGSFQAIIQETSSIADASLVGLSFSDASPENLNGLLSIATLNNIRLNQALFNHYAAEFQAFDALPGNTVTVVPEPATALILLAGVLTVFACHRGASTRQAKRNGQIINYGTAWAASLTLVLIATSARADIFRWDNRQPIPGTEGIIPGPGIAKSRPTPRPCERSQTADLAAVQTPC
jgi:Leucine-rich repeat (LRR) protein